jgi:hypothetical protein
VFLDLARASQRAGFPSNIDDFVQDDCKKLQLFAQRGPVTLTAEGRVSGRTRRATREFPSKSVKQPEGGTGVSIGRPGDLLRIQLYSGASMQDCSLWMRVDRCDDQHRIVYGTIDVASSGLGRALSRGAKLAASYNSVRENIQLVNRGMS